MTVNETIEVNSYFIETPRLRRFEIATHADDRSVQPSIATGRYEPHVQLLLETYCKDKNRVLDIGANYGQHSVLMAALNPKAEVIAIEASSQNAAVLRHNLKRNASSNVRVIEAFLGEEDGHTIDYYYETSNAGCAFGCRTDYGEVNHAEIKKQVQTVTLDTLIAEPVDFVKMDIEGAERAAILGGQRLFTHCGSLLIELNRYTSENFRNEPIDRLIDQIAGLGFHRGILCSEKGVHELTIPSIKQIMGQLELCDVLFLKA